MLTAHRLSCLRNQQILFSELEFNLSPAEILHVTGANGCGKSSLLHILVGLLLPHEGEVRWQGLPLDDKESNYLSRLTYIGHKAGVKSNLTVLENLAMAAKLARRRATPNWESILQHFGLQNLQQTLCHQLSAGQRQRVALTRLLLTDAPLWVLDEPFTALDAATNAVLQGLLVEHSRRGGMVVLTSHHPLNWENLFVKQLAL